MSGSGDSPAQPFARSAVPCMESVITSHFEMFFRYVPDKQENKVHYRNRFFDAGAVFVLIVVEGHIFAIIGISTGGGNNRAAKITADVSYNSASVTGIWFCIDIETIFIFFVNGSLCFFERRTDTVFRFIQKGSLESFAKTGVIKVLDSSPEAVTGGSAFGKKTMDMGIPFRRPAKGMQDTDGTGDKVSASVQFMGHSENNAAYSPKKAVRQGALIQKERAQIINGKNEVSAGTANEFKGHFSRAASAVLVAAGRARFGMAAERNEFQFAAVRATVHGTAIRRLTTINHLLNVFHNNGTGMKNIFNFFVMFFKNLLKDVHKTIMKELRVENNPAPQD